MDTRKAVEAAIQQAVQATGSQKAVADALGVTEQNVSNWKNRGSLTLSKYLELVELGKKKWRARDDSNVRPLPSEGSTLSS